MIAIIILLAATAVGIFIMNKSKVEYMNFAQAKKQNKIVQVIGKADKNYESLNTNPANFIFMMTDKAGQTEKVVFYEPKPMNFDLAEYVVVKGNFEGNDFIAKEILTKCPSKYEYVLDSNAKSKDTINVEKKQEEPTKQGTPLDSLEGKRGNK